MRNYFLGFISTFILTFGLVYFFSYTTLTKRVELLDTFMSLDKNSLNNPEILASLEMNLLDDEGIFEFKHSKFHFNIDDAHIFPDTTMIFEKYGHVIEFKTPAVIAYIFYIYFVTVIIIFLVQARALLNNLNKNKKQQSIMNLQNAEAKLASKNLSLLAENIHHELKTPLVVIVNKLESIREQTSFQLKTMTEKSKENGQDCSGDEMSTHKIQNDLDLIETHIDVIYNLLDRMKNFKNIKRTTENKSIYEIISVAFQTLELFSKNKFKYQIDPRLRSYAVYGTLSNEDVLNVFVNHIKNSLEAHSTKLEVALIKYHKNILYLQLLDNGDGIPEKGKESIYLPNFSTKEINKNDNESRGIGLYLSRTTLVGNGGDDFLIGTSNQGTSFGINIPGLRR